MPFSEVAYVLTPLNFIVPLTFCEVEAHASFRPYEKIPKVLSFGCF